MSRVNLSHVPGTKYAVTYEDGLAWFDTMRAAEANVEWAALSDADFNPSMVEILTVSCVTFVTLKRARRTRAKGGAA